MNNKEKFKKELQNISTPEELINKTINKVQNIKYEKTKKFIYIKPILGIACVLLISIIIGRNFLINNNTMLYRNEKNIENKEYSSLFLKEIDENLTDEDITKLKLTVETEEIDINKPELYDNTMKYIEEFTGKSNNLGITSKLYFDKDNVENYYKLNQKDIILITINEKYIIRIPKNENETITIIDLTKEKYTDYQIYPDESNEANKYLYELRKYIINEFNNEKINKEENNVETDNNQTNENQNNIELKPYGDVNRDGYIYLDDVTAIKKHINNEIKLESQEMLKAADINGDGLITGADAKLLQYAIEKTINFDGTSLIKEILYGDITMDGKITQDDYNDIKRHVNGEIKLTHTNIADINNDGLVNDTDLLLIEGILNKTFNHSTMLYPLTDYILYGDVDLNGIIQSRDASTINQYLNKKINLNNQQLKNADVNSDGTINEIDAKLVQEFVVKMHENTLPFKPINKQPQTNSNENNNTENNVELKPYGDVNRDGVINSRDVSLIKQHVEGIKTITELDMRKAADVNGDGLITGADATLLQYAVVKTINFDGTSPIKNILYGDITMDGIITQDDYNDIKRHVNGEMKLTHTNIADINIDGIVNDTDLLLIEGIINGTFNHSNMIQPLTNYTLYGDVDLNGKIQSRDASTINQYLAGKVNLNNQQLKNADVNSDGQVNETDAKLIQEFVVKMHENTLPFKPIK